MQNTKTEKDNQQVKKPVDENSGVHVTGHIKIFDPNTKEVFVSKREDG